MKRFLRSAMGGALVLVLVGVQGAVQAAEMVRANLALNKPVRVSSEQPGNDAANAVDGDLNTRWCAANSEPGHWWQVDLGQAQTIYGLRLDWEFAGPYRYRVERSLDGEKWEPLIDASQNNQAGPYKHEVTREGVRFVRVTFLGAPSGSWGSLREVSVQGKDLVPAEPPKPNLLRDVRVPTGFDVTLFAAPPAVNYPVCIAASPEGALFVSVDKNGSLGRGPHRGSVLRLRDGDGDGHAEEVRRFVADVDSPRGLVWDRDRLYLLHPPHVSVFIDHDGDGVADEERVLIKNIAFGLTQRPADHTSNGLTLGIDGWLYAAIGDFGFMEAEGTDGRKLRLRGGGVVRFRPDGTLLELFARGTRNILEVAIDPLLDAFARDNTNDGGGWDIRLHYFSGLEHHGYPSLFRNFPDEIVAPLADYGGGSGCGALYLQEPGFPDGFGNTLYTCDWGRERIFRHPLQKQGASFEAHQEEFMRLPRATDLDVDGSSRIYASSWRGGMFNYDGEDIGFIVRVTPQGYRPEPMVDLPNASRADLFALLRSPSHRRRLAAQRELLRRGLDGAAISQLQELAAETQTPLPNRVAALFALKQGLGAKATPWLAQTTADASLREFALRALTDRSDELDGVPLDPILSGLRDPDPRVRRTAAVCLARLARAEQAPALVPLVADQDPLVAHTAVQALIALEAANACLAAWDNQDAATRAGVVRVLQCLHESALVEELVGRLERETDAKRRLELWRVLCRLDHREGDWKGDSWGTRPDTSGPYYQPEDWEATPRIQAVLQTQLQRAPAAELGPLLAELSRHRVPIDGFIGDLVGRAENDSSLRDALLDLLAQGTEVPESAVPFLKRVAGGHPPDQRALVALAKVPTAEAARAILAGLAHGDTGASDRVQELFEKGRVFGSQFELWKAEAARLDPATSVWAEAALLEQARRAGRRNRRELTETLASAWKEPARRAQLLQAVAALRYRPYQEQVRSALTDPDPAVARAAQVAARALNLKAATSEGSDLIEKMKPEAVMSAVLGSHGDAKVGEQLFTRQGCVNCHTTRADEPLRGPFLGAVAAIYKRNELAEAILAPNKTIAQGFVTQSFELKDGELVEGFVTLEAADKVTIRNATGQEVVIPTARVATRQRSERSIMPEGLVNNLSVAEFASLLDFIQSLSK